MNATELKTDLVKKIEAMNLHQLKDVYGLVQNYFNSNEDVEDWNSLAPVHRKAIEIGLKQADMGLTVPLSEVMAAARRKIKLND